MCWILDEITGLEDKHWNYNIQLEQCLCTCKYRNEMLLVRLILKCIRKLHVISDSLRLQYYLYYWLTVSKVILFSVISIILLKYEHCVLFMTLTVKNNSNNKKRAQTQRHSFFYCSHRSCPSWLNSSVCLWFASCRDLALVWENIMGLL